MRLSTCGGLLVLEEAETSPLVAAHGVVLEGLPHATAGWNGTGQVAVREEEERSVA